VSANAPRTTSSVLGLEIIVLLITNFVLFFSEVKSRVKDLWSKFEIDNQGEILHERHLFSKLLVIRKKSIRDLFLRAPWGKKVNSFLVGWKALKGSRRWKVEQTSPSQPDLIKLGGEAMLIISGLCPAGSWEYVPIPSYDYRDIFQAVQEYRQIIKEFFSHLNLVRK
jgi:hypothetical protein